MGVCSVFFLCSVEEKVSGSKKAPGNCPYCGGGVTATDVERSYRLCCLPLCHKMDRKLCCSNCCRRLVSVAHPD